MSFYTRSKAAQGNSTTGGTGLSHINPESLATTLEHQRRQDTADKEATELHFLAALAAAQQLFPVYLLYYFLGYTSSCTQLNPCLCHPTSPRLARCCGTAARSRVRTPKARLLLAGQGLLSVVALMATSTALQKVPCGTRDMAPWT